MKKFITIFVALLLATVTFAQTNNTIAVPAPKAVNLSNGSDWIPLFIQGVITSNFAQYSGMKVIDRQNVDMVKAEQRLSENAAYDEATAIELGKLTSARLIITGSIMAKSNAYALTFSITDAETGETKAASNIPNCLTSALEDGTAANQVSYDLMKGYGIALSAEAQAKLTQKTSVMSGEAAAQASLAKGIVAEQSGTNIEALTYYIQAQKNDKKLGEATDRMANMTTVVTSGNFGANAKNLMKLRNDWDKLLREAAELIASNPPEFELRYFSDIEAEEMTAADYEKGTMTFTVSSPYLKQVSGDENRKIANELLDGLHKIEQSKNWGEKINGFPWSYANDIAGDNWLKLAAKSKWVGSNTGWVNQGKEEYPFTVSLFDAKQKVIAKKNITFTVEYVRQYTDFTTATDNESIRWKEPDLITFRDVAVNDADTEKLYIAVENTGNKKLSVLPAPDDVLPIRKAIAVLQSGNHNGTIKIGGAIGDYSSLPRKNDKKVALDLSDMRGKGISFGRMASLISVKLPYGVTDINGWRFDNCSALESITIPLSVRGVNPRTFGYVRENRWITVYYMGTKDDWLFRGNAKDPDGARIRFIDEIEKQAREEAEQKQREQRELEQRMAEAEEKARIETEKHSAKIAEYLAHLENSIPVNDVPEVIDNLKGNATIKVKGYVGNKRAIATAISKSKYMIHLDLSAAEISSIGMNDFEGCGNLIGITIPSTITFIGSRAFSGCSSLKTIMYTGSKKQWKKIEIQNGNEALLKAKINYDYKGE